MSPVYQDPEHSSTVSRFLGATLAPQFSTPGEGAGIPHSVCLPFPATLHGPLHPSKQLKTGRKCAGQVSNSLVVAPEKLDEAPAASPSCTPGLDQEMAEDTLWDLLVSPPLIVCVSCLSIPELWILVCLLVSCSTQGCVL